jgi:hypothetical protein
MALYIGKTEFELVLPNDLLRLSSWNFELENEGKIEGRWIKSLRKLPK